MTWMCSTCLHSLLKWKIPDVQLRSNKKKVGPSDKHCHAAMPSALAKCSLIGALSPGIPPAEAVPPPALLISHTQPPSRQSSKRPAAV